MIENVARAERFEVIEAGHTERGREVDKKTVAIFRISLAKNILIRYTDFEALIRFISVRSLIL
jgi:hypothetical protein